MFAQNNLKQTGKKPLTLVGAAKAVFWPKRENVKNDAQTEFFRAGYFVIIFLHGCSNITNFRFQKSYGHKTRKSKYADLGIKWGIIRTFFKLLRHFKGEHGH